MGLLSRIFGDENGVRSNGHPYVDLGLSVYWATMNVGARFKYEYGIVRKWGETRAPQLEYKFGYPGCRFCYTRYTTKPGSTPKGKPDYQTTLLRRDDVAHRRMRGDWRMPTVDELEELLYTCQWDAILYNRAIRAYRITGPNGNSIVLPQMHIWTSSLHSSNSHAYCLYFYDNGPAIKDFSREDAYYIRAVLSK